MQPSAAKHLTSTTVKVVNNILICITCKRNIVLTAEDTWFDLNMSHKQSKAISTLAVVQCYKCTNKGQNPVDIKAYSIREVLNMYGFTAQCIVKDAFNQRNLADLYIYSMDLKDTPQEYLDSLSIDPSRNTMEDNKRVSIVCGYYEILTQFKHGYSTSTYARNKLREAEDDFINPGPAVNTCPDRKPSYIETLVANLF